MYRPWLKDLIRLKAYTGRRNAELFNEMEHDTL